MGSPGQFLVTALSQTANRMERTEAARICGTAAKALVDALGDETHAGVRSSLASALSELAARVEPAEAAKALFEELLRETDPHARIILASALSELAVRMEPKEATEFCNRVVTSLLKELGRESDAYYRGGLALALSRVLVRVPREAARARDQAAKALLAASSVSGLTTLASQMAPREAAALCGSAIRLVLQKRFTGGPRTMLSTWDFPVLEPQLLAYLAPEAARALTWESSSLNVSTRNINSLINEVGFAELLEDRSRAQIHRRAVFTAVAAAQAASGQFAWAGVPAAEPFPCRLTTQQLIELLKMPTCFGQARRVVLDQLGNRYGRWFVNHWAFVRFASEQSTRSRGGVGEI
jgi:hypothetical protein